MSEQSVHERLAEMERRIEQMVVRGVVSAVSDDCQKVKVKYGDKQFTGWLEWKPIRSGRGVMWWVPEIGEGVTVISPGDLALGEVLPGSYHANFKAPSNDPDLFLMQFGDGGLFSYHRGSGNMKFKTSGDLDIDVSGDANITAGGDMKLTATRIDIN